MSVERWLDRFARCVRACDFDGARPLFDPAVHAFGTRAEYLDGRDDLLRRQWGHVWPQTRGFRFLDTPRVTETSADGSLVCVVALWESDGVTADDGTFPRRGRCTVVLRRNDEGAYLAIHSHFSRSPDGAV